MADITSYCVGEWLPSDEAFLNSWLTQLLQRVEPDRKLHPVIEDFKDFIEAEPEVYMLFNQMFTQVKHHTNPAGDPQVKDYRQMLHLLNMIMTMAPEFNESGLVGFPINAILNWSMGTTSGYAAFLMEKINVHLKRVLDQWARFLGSADSLEVLNDGPNGWFSPEAFKAMAPDNCPDPQKYFVDTFVCDPDQPYYGFLSWDDFFTRRFRENARPVATGDNTIVNACESAPYDRQFKVKRHAKFWIKGQPYSLEHMMAHDPLVDQFVHGTVYQAFLSAKNYHQWHSPVNGTVLKAYNVPGTYYSESLENRHDEAGPNDSQGYITSVAARALIFIESDDPRIGLMCFMAVGMAEVSTCDIAVYEGQHISKGDYIGTFHFGGSTHCLI
ncbi:MAG: phosphatidylserine decarboxylase family protein, partial [bacterium]|nr:phosphatidylserine decarboxylase family protein [bacterium]